MNRELQHGERKGPEMLIILIIVLVLVFGGVEGTLATAVGAQVVEQA